MRVVLILHNGAELQPGSAPQLLQVLALSDSLYFIYPGMNIIHFLYSMYDPLPLPMTQKHAKISKQGEITQGFRSWDPVSTTYIWLTIGKSQKRMGLEL